MQVCSCNNVDKGTIFKSVTEGGLATVGAVKSTTKVRPCCRCYLFIFPPCHACHACLEPALSKPGTTLVASVDPITAIDAIDAIDHWTSSA